MNSPSSEEELFVHALALTETERRAYLTEACGDDTDLRARVELLLRAHDQAKGFMESPPAPGLAGALTQQAPPPEEKAGERLGRYKLLERIGEGGCGVVYVAEQEEPVRRRVALKVIKLGMDTREVIARFEAERQALALMDHPNIAKVFDAGATDTGRPYFVMELVRGIPLTQYCDNSSATTAERLQLFIQICHAVQHAHQKGIIHRDLKPSNILVTINDDVAVPKIIDFGIAKATQGRLTDKTVYTAFQQFIGTPAYMSPEQAVLTSLDIDTRSDIYSLGVLLYELLTGRTPFDAKTLFEAGLDEIRRQIREVEPPKPSTRLSTMEGEALTTTAHLRHTEPPKLVSLVRGDLDWIVMRCLEKDRVRRYETANGLAEDIRRHLANEPVAACPPSTAYRVQKFVRRNKFAVAAAAAIAAALLIGAAVATWQAVRATRAERRAVAARELAEQRRTEADAARSLAERRRNEVDTISNLILSEALGSVVPKSEADDPTLKAAMAGREITLREVLDHAAARVPNAFAGNPLLEAAIRSTIGETYLKLSLYAKAAPHLQAAWEARQRHLGEEHPETLAALRRLTTIWQDQRKHDQVETTLKKILAVQERTLGVDDPETLETLWYLGQSKIMRLDVVMQPAKRAALAAEAIAFARTCLEKASKRFGPEDLRTLRHLQNLFYLLMHHSGILATDPIGRTRGAHEVEAMGAQLLATQRKVLGEAHPDTLETMGAYCKALGAVGKGAESERSKVAVIRLYERIYGPDHETMAIVVRWLAVDHLAAGRLAEAAEQYKRFAASVPKRHGWDSLHTRTCLHEFGDVMVRCGKAAEAETFALERLPEAQRLTRPNSPGVLGLKFILGAAVLAQGRAAEAEPLLRECRSGLLGAALLAQQKYAEAEPLLLDNFERNLRRLQETGGLWWLNLTLWDAYDQVLKLYTELKQPEKVAEWQKRQPEVAKVVSRRTFRPSPKALSSLPNRAPINLAFDLPAEKPSPSALEGDPGFPGWTAGGKPARYRYQVNRPAPPGGPQLQITSLSAELNDFASLLQRFRVDDYRSRRVRFSLQMRIDDTGGGGYASASLRVDRQDGAQVAYTSRTLLGVAEWREQAMVFDLPANARSINMALVLHGRGTLSVREVKFETVGPEVPADNTLEHPGSAALPAPIAAAILNRKAPENLAFTGSGEATAQTALGVPAGWGIGGSASADYVAGVDRTQPHTQPVSGYLKSTKPVITGFGTLMQSFSAENFRGKRMQFSVDLKTADVADGVDLWLRTDGKDRRQLTFANSSMRIPSLTGTTDWTRRSIVLEVSPEAEVIYLGIILKGTGQVWINDARFEIVGPEVPATTAPSKAAATKTAK